MMKPTFVNLQRGPATVISADGKIVRVHPYSMIGQFKEAVYAVEGGYWARFAEAGGPLDPLPNKVPDRLIRVCNEALEEREVNLVELLLEEPPAVEGLVAVAGKAEGSGEVIKAKKKAKKKAKRKSKRTPKKTPAKVEPPKEEPPEQPEEPAQED